MFVSGKRVCKQSLLGCCCCFRSSVLRLESSCQFQGASCFQFCFLVLLLLRHFSISIDTDTFLHVDFFSSGRKIRVDGAFPDEVGRGGPILTECGILHLLLTLICVHFWSIGFGILFSAATSGTEAISGNVIWKTVKSMHFKRRLFFFRYDFSSGSNSAWRSDTNSCEECWEHWTGEGL